MSKPKPEAKAQVEPQEVKPESTPVNATVESLKAKREFYHHQLQVMSNNFNQLDVMIKQMHGRINELTELIGDGVKQPEKE